MPPAPIQFKSVEPRLAPPSRGQQTATRRSGRPRCPPSEEQRHHSVEASVRTSGRQSCVAGASKTQVCRKARPPRGARAESRDRCAGSAPDLFFVRPNAPGHDLPSPVFLRRCQEGQAMARHVSSSSSWIRRVSVVHGTRHERTLRAPRSRSHCSCRPHLSACAESVGGYAGRDAQAERELREGAARPRRDRAGVFARRRARCRRGAA